MSRSKDRRKEYLVVRLYRIALKCFPASYRAEYAEELLYAVRMAAAEAQGGLPLARLAWRELRDLPLAALRAHLFERNAIMKASPGNELRGWKLAAVFLPFLLPLLLTLPGLLGATDFVKVVSLAVGVPLLGLLVVTWIGGLAREFPAWALPALGLVLYFITAMLGLALQILGYYAAIVPLFGGWPHELSLKTLFALLGALAFTPIMAVLLAGLLRAVPTFHQRVRKEWTLLSFLLYGMAIAPVFVSDEFRYVEGYQIASLVALAAGAGLYLAAKRRWQRILALIVPVVLAEALMSFGMYQVYPQHDWANLVNQSARLWESIQPLLNPLPVLLLLPALAPSLPWGGDQLPVPTGDRLEA